MDWEKELGKELVKEVGKELGKDARMEVVSELGKQALRMELEVGR